MKAGTGSKRRSIKGNNIAMNSSFEFNRSINPRGGTDSSMFASKTRKGYGVIKIHQDLNDDGILSRKELIYKGKSRDQFAGDTLLNFNGDVQLTKTMHRCHWLYLKNPTAEIACTLEFIPTVYELRLADSNGELFTFDAMGEFKSLEIV